MTALANQTEDDESAGKSSICRSAKRVEIDPNSRRRKWGLRPHLSRLKDVVRTSVKRAMPARFASSESGRGPLA